MKYFFSSNIVTESLMKEYTNFRERNFVDRLKLVIKAGNGGRGCVTYYRDRKVRTGAPDGGSGGRGGNVYFRAINKIYDLNHLKKPTYEGNNGKPGMKSKKDGKDGGDMKLSVPVGTIVYNIKEVTEDNKLIKDIISDLDFEGKEALVAKGGVGGKGNANNIGIKDPEPGGLGEVRNIYLELKCIADVGLVGFPNAGKSTFLASVTRALPKIAEYPFTTLNPMIGKVQFIDGNSFTIADIPGIIEDAHKNKGLGLDFLRHIERTRVYIYIYVIIDVNIYD